MSLLPEDQPIVDVHPRVARILNTRRPLRRRLSLLACAFMVAAGMPALPEVRAQDRASAQEASAKKPVTGGAEVPGRTTGGLDLRVVHRKTGQPVPGASIESPQISGITDEQGRYRISWTNKPPTRLWFNVRKPDFAQVQVHWDHFNTPGAPELPREYTIELDPGSEIGGIVRDEQGGPIAGAGVVVSGNSSDPPKAGGPRIHVSVTRQAQTDATGRWKCDGVPDRINLTLRITHPEFVAERNSGRLTSYQPKELDELRAGDYVRVLRRGSTIVGQVRDANGQPVAGAEISLFGGRERPLRSDAAGRFELAHLPPGPNRLVVRASGHVPATRSAVAGDDLKPIEIRLEKGRSVSGRVVDHTNQPVARAMVHFEFGYGERDGEPMCTAEADGRFRLDGVPDEPGSLFVAQFLSRVSRPLSPSEREVTVVLPTFPVVVKGKVTDAETGQPVPAFNLVMSGCLGGRVASVDGQFRMEWTNWTWCKDLSVAIEADGYAFTEWRTVPAPSGQAEVTMDFRIKKGAPVVCVVRAADGSPLPDAEIGPSTPAREDSGFALQFRIVDAHLRPNTNTYAPVKTEPDGRFSLAPFERPYSVVVAHQRGFAILESAPVRGTRDAPAEITLQPWGRVEGTLRIGNRPGVRERITLDWSEPAGFPLRFAQQRLEITTDDEGRFAFDRVLPGTWRIEALRSQPIPAFQVDPGQATRLVLGGTGRPVIGRLSLPAEIEANPEKRISGGLSGRAERPGRPEGRTDEERRRRDEEARNNRQWFDFTPQPDGTFRVEDVPPGNYDVMAWCYAQIGEGQQRESRTVGMIRRTITVPESPAQKDGAAKPFDIGTVSLEPFLAAGQPAPEFRATTFDGKPIRLSDFRGKHVLVLFWGLNQRGGLEESRAIRSLLKYKSLANGERLVVLGVCTGPSSLGEARAVVSQRGWDWLNAVDEIRPRDRPRVQASDSLLVRYRLPSRPSVWLIGPDGKIVGRDLRGDSIKAAAATVLRAK